VALNAAKSKITEELTCLRQICKGIFENAPESGKIEEELEAYIQLGLGNLGIRLKHLSHASPTANYACGWEAELDLVRRSCVLLLQVYKDNNMPSQPTH
jgi:hypothetical protein